MNTTTELTLEMLLEDAAQNPNLQKWLDEADYQRFQLDLFIIPSP